MSAKTRRQDGMGEAILHDGWLFVGGMTAGWAMCYGGAGPMHYAVAVAVFVGARAMRLALAARGG